MSTITNTTINHGITIGATYTSPLTITTTGTVNNNGTGTAIYYDGTATIQNAGQIIATGAAVPHGNLGISLTGNGSVGNSGLITASGYAIYFGNAGTVTNAGTVSGYYGVEIRGTSAVSNSSTGTITGTGRYGVKLLGATASVTNDGTISGRTALQALFSATVDNTGLLSGLDGVNIVGAASLRNSGSIIANSSDALGLGAGGTITNAAGGYITDTVSGYGDAVLVTGGAATITNAGTLSAYTGIDFTGTAASQTVIDSGTIIGSGGTAVAFGAGNDLMEFQPSTSAFTEGVVDGGAGTNTLEFASAANTGTLTGLGADFLNFSQGTVDANASWILAGSNTLGSTVTLTDSGTLTDFATLANSGVILLTGGVLTAGGLSGTGSVTIGANSTLGITGPVASTENVVFNGTNALLSLSGSGLITGASTGVTVATGGDTVSNAGSIGGNATNGTGIKLLAGGLVTDQSNGMISGYNGIYAGNAAATVLNVGTISGATSASGHGIFLDAGGSVTNLSGGMITGSSGVLLYHAAATVVNAGSIAGSPNYGVGVALFAGSSLTNQSGGTITGYDGIFIVSGRYVTNQTGGAILGAFRGVYAAAGFVTVVNAGSIAIDGSYAARAPIGVYLAGGGYLTNQSSGTISGGTDAVRFAAGFGDRLVIDPGAVFTGTVNGGNTIGGVAVSTLELASGASTGTLAGFGSQYVNFAQITIDAAANWTLNDTNTIVALETLTASGTLTDSGTLANDGSIIVANYQALQLAPGDYLRNDATGTITRNATGSVSLNPLLFGAPGGASTVVNLGTMENLNGGLGIMLLGPGAIVNGSTGVTSSLIEGATAVYTAGRGTVTNFGTIQGNPTAYGNAIALAGGGTVIDAGTIIGTGGAGALKFGVSGGSGGSNDLLLLEHGFSLTGPVMATGTTGNVVELLGTAAGAAVTANYNSLSLTNFSTIEFAPGASNYATLAISNNAILPGTIAGFIGTYDTIDLTTLSDTGNDATTSFNTLTNVLTVTGDSGSVQLQLDSESYTGIVWVAQNDGSGGTAVHPRGLAPPVITGTQAGQMVNDNATDLPFSTTTITDPNGNLSETLTITLSNGGTATDTDGMLSGTGLTQSGIGIYTLSAPNAATATSELNALVFTPTPHQVAPGSTVTTAFKLAVTDGVGQSATDSATTVIATAVASMPAINGTVGNQGVPNQSASMPFGKVTVTDPTFGVTDTATVALSAPGNGTLSNLSGGSYNAATGIYSLTATAAAITAALDSLVFTPIAQPNVIVSTTSFALAVQGAGGTANDSTTSVTSVDQILGLATVPLTNISISVTPDGTGFAAPVNGDTNEAVVSAPVTGGSYVLPAGFQAMFLGSSASATLSDSSVGNALLVGNQGNDTIAALGANQSIAGGSGTNVLFDFGTSDTIFAQGRNDTIAGGSLAGGMVMNSGSGAAIFAGTSGLTVVDAGMLSTIVGSSGALVATVGAGGGGDLLVGRTGSVVATDVGNNDTVAAGTGAMSVTGSGNNLIAFGGTGGLQFVDTAGSSTVLAAAGATNTVSLTGGQVLVAVQPSASVTVNGSSGLATLYGGASSNVVLQNGGGSVLYAAGFGNETLNGADASAGNQLFGGLDANGANSIVGGSGNDTLVAGSGADTLVGNGASNLFVFFHANGAAAPQDFIGGYQSDDLVVLSGYGTAAASIAQSGATSSSGNTTITLADNTTITFLGVSSASGLHLASN
jgi:hypothetical protein